MRRYQECDQDQPYDFTGPFHGASRGHVGVVDDCNEHDERSDNAEHPDGRDGSFSGVFFPHNVFGPEMNVSQRLELELQGSAPVRHLPARPGCSRSVVRRHRRP